VSRIVAQDRDGGFNADRPVEPYRELTHPLNKLPPAATQSPNLAAARAFAFVASSSRFFGGAFVSSEWRKRLETEAISSTAARNASSFAFDGLLKPLIFLTNWSDEARISSVVTGGSKLNSVLMFLHMCFGLGKILAGVG
jgi:hypothetical protein